MSDPSMIRVVNDPPLDGATNMARDEALLTRVAELASPPTLRLYQWDPPTISLGYFQHHAQYEALAEPAGVLAVVRRLTGGGAILHDLELTYSLTLPTGHSLLVAGASRLYELAHDAIMASLADLDIHAKRCGETDDSGAARGPFFCFDRRHAFDLLVGDAKIAGSAQRRTRTGILQHGSIMLANRYSQQTTAVTSLPFEKSIQQLRSSVPEELSNQTGVLFEPGSWSPEELCLADQLTAKYAGSEWRKRL